MATAQQHYDDLLADIYVWMVGGLDAALAAGAADEVHPAVAVPPCMTAEHMLKIQPFVRLKK